MFAASHVQAPTLGSHKWGLVLVMIAIVTGIAAIAVISMRVQNGRIDGRVLDDHGNAVTSATVDARRLVTGEVTRVEARSDGSFVFPSVSPGKYSLAVQASGYSTVSVTRFPVGSRERVRREFVLLPLL